ncbi:hypothetical protein Tco_0544083 [Tanacetum coccineum]
MVRLRALGSNTESGVPYTDEEINAMARKGKQRGHLPGVVAGVAGAGNDAIATMWTGGRGTKRDEEDGE